MFHVAVLGDGSSAGVTPGAVLGIVVSGEVAEIVAEGAHDSKKAVL